mgnify:CR=1
MLEVITSLSIKGVSAPLFNFRARLCGLVRERPFSVTNLPFSVCTLNRAYKSHLSKAVLGVLPSGLARGPVPREVELAACDITPGHRSRTRSHHFVNLAPGRITYHSAVPIRSGYDEHIDWEPAVRARKELVRGPTASLWPP